MTAGGLNSGSHECAQALYILRYLPNPKGEREAGGDYVGGVCDPMCVEARDGCMTSSPATPHLTF